MPEKNVRLPNMERVNVIGGFYPKLMEIADPIPYWFVERLAKDELIKLIGVGLEYQSKLIEVEMGRLKVQAEALGEMHKVIKGYK